MRKRPGIPIREITKRLRLSRNYIQKFILPHVQHEKSAHGLILVDEIELRQWLMTNAEFSRQTKLVSFEDMGVYMSVLSKLKIQTRVPGASLRQRLPFRRVVPFDFWNETLLFSDDERFPNAESFFRAMYQCGAIRIKLSKRKTMFWPQLQYSAEDLKKGLEDSPEGTTIMDIQDRVLSEMATRAGAELFPAVDETPAATKAFRAAEKEKNVYVDIKGKEDYVKAIVRHLLEIDGYVDYFQIDYSNGQKAAHIKIPNASILKWVYPDYDPYDDPTNDEPDDQEVGPIPYEPDDEE